MKKKITLEQLKRELTEWGGYHHPYSGRRTKPDYGPKPIDPEKFHLGKHPKTEGDAIYFLHQMVGVALGKLDPPSGAKASRIEIFDALCECLEVLGTPFSDEQREFIEKKIGDDEGDSSYASASDVIRSIGKWVGYEEWPDHLRKHIITQYKTDRGGNARSESIGMIRGCIKALLSDIDTAIENDKIGYDPYTPLFGSGRGLHVKDDVTLEAVEDLNAGSSYDEIQSELEDADYESFCKQLSFLVKNKDPKSQALYNTFKEGWKDEYRDITVSEKFISIRDLHPTQNVIFANKSLVPMLNGKWQIGGKSAVEVVLSGKSVNIPLGDPLVVCNVGGTNYLIDGHHRWSKFYAFNPTCNLQAYIIEDKSGKGLFASADDVLKFAQGTLAALGQDTINPQSAGDTNMYDMDLAMLTDIVNKNTSPEILQIVINSPVTGGVVKDKTTLANYLWQNLYTNMFEYAPAGAHDREYMPQYPSGMDPETAVDTISENTKFTLTVGQLRKLVKEASSCRHDERTIRNL